MWKGWYQIPKIIKTPTLRLFIQNTKNSGEKYLSKKHPGYRITKTPGRAWRETRSISQWMELILWPRLGYLILIGIEFDDFTSPLIYFFYWVKILVSIEIEKIYQTVENYSLHSQTPQNSSKILRSASYIQFFSECLELNAMKRCPPCLICFVKARS